MSKRDGFVPPKDSNNPNHSRPSLPLRSSSYSKRHASFDSPREIPLPRLDYPDSVFSDDSQESAEEKERRDSGYNSLEPPPSLLPQLHQGKSPVLPNSRPFSTPDSSSILNPPSSIQRPNWPPDRSSTASLPLPSSTPYHTLPLTVIPSIPPTMQEESSTNSNTNPPTTNSANTSTSELPASSPSSSSSALTDPTPPSPTLSDPTHLHRASSLPDSEYAMFSEFSIPPPEPPTVLTPTTETRTGPEAPHERILSHVNLHPNDAWITVETKTQEYRLVVKLPGFNRQSITIATRKRRILHIVADRWEDGGGHFERRVSFGYDADLAQVRAEFDGEYLLVKVPRRLPPMFLNPPRSRLR